MPQISQTPSGRAAGNRLSASVAGRSVGELAQELLGLARQGLAARVAAGTEPAHVLNLLDPLAEVVRTGTTFAQRCLDGWLGESDRRLPAARSPFGH